MAEIINLNKFKKTRNQKSKKRQAMANRVKFGQTKAGKTENISKAHHKDKKLTGKKMDNEGTDLT